MKTTFVLGESDPEMALIGRLLDAAGQPHVTVGEPLPAAARYVAVELRADALARLWACRAHRLRHPSHADGYTWDACGAIGAGPCDVPEVVVIDHHDDHPAASLPPLRAVEASSIGQVISLLARDGIRPDGAIYARPASVHDVGRISTTGRPPAETRHCASSAQASASVPYHVCVSDPVLGGAWYELPARVVMCAAADHCLAAAYRGEVPGVDPDALGRWRAATRAAHQERAVADILADVEAARDILRCAPRLDLGGVAVADLRPHVGAWAEALTVAPVPSRYAVPCGARPDAHPDGGAFPGPTCWGDVPELPEAAARDGVAFIAISQPGRDGRKLVLQAAPAAAVEAFLRGEGPAAGLVRLYGAPSRGFAGGYFE